jgi:transcriptional regulator with XRE-family HTH domain
MKKDEPTLSQNRSDAPEQMKEQANLPAHNDVDANRLNKSLPLIIGKKLRSFRKTSNLKITDLSKRTGLSCPLISRIENGLVTPSLQSLINLATVLRVEIGEFFKLNSDEQYVITRNGRRSKLLTERGKLGKVSYHVELLTAGFSSPFMEPAIVDLVAKKADLIPVTHGGQELILCLEGKMILLLGNEEITLNKWDTAYFNGNLPHLAYSKGAKIAKALSVHIIPGRRDGTFQNT